MGFNCLFWTLVLACASSITSGNDSVLKLHHLQPSDLQPSDIAIVQFDTRPLGSEYWGVAARWNFAYCRQHGHKYYYISNAKADECKYADIKLSAVWCKVKAMLTVSEQHPEIKAFVYLDSDALVTSNHSMAIVLSFITAELKWDMTRQPVALNQDHDNKGCKSALKYGYPVCINTGTVFWLNNDLSLQILRSWWHFAGKPYSASRWSNKWRHKWPWEQGPIHDIYIEYEKHIMRLSFPDLPMLPWPTLNPKKQYPTGEVSPWCFSHWPGANCFITHFCASAKQKGKIIERHNLPGASDPPVLYI